MGSSSSPVRKRSHREERSRSKKAKKHERKSRKDSKKARKRERDHSSDERKHKRRRHRHRRDSSDDDSHSDSSDSDDEQRRERSGRKERDQRADASSVGRGAPPDHKAALGVVRELLSEFPSIAPELLSLLQMLDDGEAAVLSGISNSRIRSLLVTLFPLLGLEKVPDVEDAFRVPISSGESSLLETVAGMLSSDDLAGGAHSTDPSPKKPMARSAPIGPQMPAKMPAPTQPPIDDDDEGDDSDIGPALPGTKGYRQADPLVEAEMERRALELSTQASVGKERENSGSAPMVREDWMTQMPEKDPLFRDAMGPNMRRSSGKPAAFRSKEPAAIDQSWFDTPEERDRAQRAKMDIELLGYVREENAPRASTQRVPDRNQATGGVHDSIMPAANPQVDEEIRLQMEALKQRRGPSLLEQHQQKMAEDAKQNGNRAARSAGWDRERDLVVRKTLSREDADRIIASSQQISSKFTAPTVTRQFL
ncbi:hypothetical protein PINS_up003548 [Pythium insidiosum]|nr:hypothetical protein PINS_up003548 [Pythium insidiosum]